MDIKQYRIVHHHCYIQKIGGPILEMEYNLWPLQAHHSWNGGLSDARPPSFTCSSLHQGNNPIMPGCPRAVSSGTYLEYVTQGFRSSTSVASSAQM